MKNTVARQNPHPSACRVTAGDVNIYHARLLADQQITYVFEFADRLDPDQLMASLRILHEALPILSRVVHISGSHFTRVPIADYQPTVCVESAINDPAESIQRFTSTPCDPERDAPLTLLLLRPPGGDILCFKTDHVLCDAEGLKDILWLFAEAYTQNKITQAVNRNRGFGQVFRRCSPVALFHATQHASLPKPGPALLDGPFETTSRFLEHAVLAPVQFQQMRAAAKHVGATVNDVVLTALYRAVWEHLEQAPSTMPSSYPVMVPVDMRRYVPSRHSLTIANLSSAIYPSLSFCPGESFEGTLCRVKVSMGALKSDDPGLGALELMTIGALQGGKRLRDRYRLAATHGSRFINCTNFGVIAQTNCTFGSLRPEQAYGVGPLQFAPGFLMAVSTYLDTLHLVVQGNDVQRFQPFIRSLLNTMIAQLRAGC